jgi:multidrug efflux system membrane fusion protein
MIFQQLLTSAILISLLSLLVACDSQPQSQYTPQAPAVSVANVISERITEWDEFTGRLEAPQSVSLRPRISGYIESIQFKEGSLVNAGDVLFKIDDAIFKAEVERLTATLADVSSQLKLAKSSYTRANELSSNKAISQELFDSRSAELEQAHARLRSTSAALEVAKLNLSYTQVKAPISGRVSRALMTKGNLVKAADTLLTTLVSVGKVYAYFDADEQTYLKYMKLAKEGTRPSSRDVKNPVYLALANDQGYPHEGYMDFVDNQINPATGTIRGRAVFDNINGNFIPGMFARLKLVGSASYDGILIDDKAINTDLKNKYVLLMDAENKATYRAVTLGEKLNGLRIIKFGLTAGDQIIVNGLQRVQSGGLTQPTLVPMAKEAVLDGLHAMQLRIDNTLSRLSFADAKVTAAEKVVGG